MFEIKKALNPIVHWREGIWSQNARFHSSNLQKEKKKNKRKPLFNGFQKIKVRRSGLSHVFDGLQEMIFWGFVLSEAVIKMAGGQAKQPFILMSVASEALLKVGKQSL